MYQLRNETATDGGDSRVEHLHFNFQLQHVSAKRTKSIVLVRACVLVKIPCRLYALVCSESMLIFVFLKEDRYVQEIDLSGFFCCSAGIGW